MASISFFRRTSNQIARLAVRFPILLLATIATTVLSILVVLERVDNFVAIRFFLAAALVFPGVLLGALIAEKYRLHSGASVLLQGILGVLLSLVYFLLPENATFLFSTPLFVRIRLFAFALIILAVIFPFDGGGMERLWQHAASVMRACIIAALFSIPIGIGLTLASLALWNLFHVQFISLGQALAIIWVVAAQIIGAWMFLSAFPRPHHEPTYLQLSRMLQIFLYYVLLPIVGIYFVILYAYVVKILFTWDWPDGGVAYWILGLSTVGMIAYSASLGKVERYERIQKRFFFTFFILLLPLVGVLFFAIGLRIHAYGLTPDRILVVVGGVWLAAVAIYSLLRGKYPLLFMPYTGVGLLLLSLIGPWNIFHLSLVSQGNRLERILSEQQILVNGHVVLGEETNVVSQEEYETIRSIVSAIISYGGVERIQSWVTQDLSAGIDRDTLAYVHSRKIMDALGIEEDGFPRLGTYAFSHTQQFQSGYVTGGYDFIFPDINLFGSDIDTVHAVVLQDFGTASFLLIDQHRVALLRDGQTLLEVDMTPWFDALIDSYGNTTGLVNESDMTHVYENDQVKVKMIIRDIYGEKQMNAPSRIAQMNATFLVAFK